MSLGIAILSGGPAAAAPPAPCQLHQVLDLPIVQTSNNRWVVTAEADGKPVRMFIDTGAFFSFLTPDAVSDLPKPTIDYSSQTVRGRQWVEFVKVPELKLGNGVIRNERFGVSLGYFPAVLGADLLSKYDVELDPATSHLRLFEPADCADPVYWKHSDEAALPIDLDQGRHLSTEITLDGHALSAVLDTGAPFSSIGNRTTKDTFGIALGTLPQFGTDPGRRLLRVDLMQFGGIKFHHAPVTVHAMAKMTLPPGPDAAGDKLDTAPRSVDMLVGVHQLRNLHLFVAYARRTAFVTSVAGDTAAGSPPPVPRPADDLDADAHVAEVAAIDADIKAARFEQAQAALDKVLDVLPTWIAGLTMRADLYAALGDRARAAEAYAAVIGRWPDEPAGYFGRAQDEMMRGEAAAAVRDLDQVLRLESDSVPALTLRCEARTAAGDVSPALEDCEQAMHLAPGYREARAAEGAAYIAKGRVAAGMAYVSAVLSAEPGNRTALRARADAETRQGDSRAAAADLAVVKASSPWQDAAQHDR